MNPRATVVLTTALVSCCLIGDSQAASAAATPPTGGHSQGRHLLVERQPDKAGRMVKLEVKHFSDVVVDPAHKHLFVSGGVSGLLVTDLRGATVAKIPVTHAEGLAISPDGSTVYLADSAGNAVDLVDTATLGVTVVPTGADSCPSDVAVTDGAVWYATGCDGAPGGLGVIDLDDNEAVDVDVSGLDTEFDEAPLLESVPGAESFVTVDPTTRSAEREITVFGASGVTPSVLASIQPGDAFYDVDVASDGASVVMAGDSTLVRYSLPALHRVIAYQPPEAGLEGARAVAQRADGRLAASAPYHSTHIFLPAERSYFARALGPQVFPHGLAWDDDTLLQIGFTRSVTSIYLKRSVPRTSGYFRVRANNKVVPYGGKTAIAVKAVHFPDQAVIDVYVKPAGGRERLVEQVPANPRRYVPVRVRVTTHSDVRVAYAGTDDWKPTSEHVAVRVHAKLDARLTGGKRVRGETHYRTNQRPVLLSHLLPDRPNSCLRVVAQIWRGGGWRRYGDVDCARLD